MDTVAFDEKDTQILADKQEWRQINLVRLRHLSKSDMYLTGERIPAAIVCLLTEITNLENLLSMGEIHGD